jgi:hypothetical protein
MFLPGFRISYSEILISNRMQVFGVLFLGRPGEIEAPGNNRFPIDDHDLIVGDRMGSVYLVGIALFTRKFTEEYSSVKLLLSKMTSTLTPLL